MNGLTSRIVFSGLLFVLTVISGVLLRNAGRPFNGLLFTGHKLIAVATVILMVVSAIQVWRQVDTSTLIILSLALAGLLFAVLIASGALLTFDTLASPTILRLHRTATALALLAASASAYLLSGIQVAQQIGAVK